jgi:anthranilate synthase/aminodeoxychorismate synthase-like glutamine amidotransferase
LRELGVQPRIFKNDEITINELKKMNFSSLIISPGPKNPDEAGISLEAIKEFYKTKKILGVCLGHQCIAQYFGAKIIKAKEPVHGKVSEIYFEPDPLFKGLKQGFLATRYHSLIVDNATVPDCLKTIGYTKEPNLIMALKHRNYPVYGVQFHPEAILTQGGKKLLENFLRLVY